MIDTTPAGLRRAALLLHALPVTDRRWLLGRLDDGQRRQLQALLDELAVLGVQVDAADVAALTSTPPDAGEAADPGAGLGAGLVDEPVWIRQALADAGVAPAPAARRALRQAAARRRDEPVPPAAPVLGARAPAPASFWQGVRRWLR